MRATRGIFAHCSLALVLAGYGASSSAFVTEEDRRLIEAAGCDDIVREHGNFAKAEKALAEEIRRNDSSTTAGNVAGAASLAIFGLGFFSWNDQADARENLAELTAYREAIAAEGRKKKCSL